MADQLFFIGYMAAGKTTAAAALADLTGLPMLDLDAAIEAREGRTISEVFKAVGEAGFRSLERDMLEEVTGHPQYRIVSCGGGLACSPGAVERMKLHGHVVWLNPPFETICERLDSEPGARPLLKQLGWPSVESLRDHFTSRTACYAAADESVVGVDDDALNRWSVRLGVNQS